MNDSKPTTGPDAASAEIRIWTLECFGLGIARLTGAHRDGRLMTECGPVPHDAVIIAVVPDGVPPTVAEFVRAWRTLALPVILGAFQHAADWERQLAAIADALPDALAASATTDNPAHVHDAIIAASEWMHYRELHGDELWTAWERMAKDAVRADVPDARAEELDRAVRRLADDQPLPTVIAGLWESRALDLAVSRTREGGNA